MDLAKSCADNFRLIPANSAVRGALRVRAQSKIARTRADFGRFSKKCKKRWTGWWSKRDLNPRPHTHRMSREVRGLFRATQANLGHRRICSPIIRPKNITNGRE